MEKESTEGSRPGRVTTTAEGERGGGSLGSAGSNHLGRRGGTSKLTSDQIKVLFPPLQDHGPISTSWFGLDPAPSAVPHLHAGGEVEGGGASSPSSPTSPTSLQLCVHTTMQATPTTTHWACSEEALSKIGQAGGMKGWLSLNKKLLWPILVGESWLPGRLEWLTSPDTVRSSGMLEQVSNSLELSLSQTRLGPSGLQGQGSTSRRARGGGGGRGRRGV